MQFSAGYDVRPKNKSIRKCKKWHCATGIHDPCIADWFRQVPTSLDKSERVWSAIFPQPWVARCPNLAHPQTCVQFSNRTSLEILQPSQVVETALCHASIGVRCELVWSATFLRHTSKTNTSLESCPLAGLRYAISAGQDVRLKNYRARSFFGQSLSMGS